MEVGWIQGFDKKSDKRRKLNYQATKEASTTITFTMSLNKPEEQLAQELTCPICLQLFSNPLVLPCGHNYCQACLQKTTDKTGKTLPRCPECREEYHGVDTLQKNFKLCNIIQGYLASAPPLLDGQPEPPQRAEVYCDHCIDEHTLAVKTCLKCEVSLCSRHLQRHHEKESFRGHSVVEPLTDLGLKECALHRRPLEYFCSNDMTSLCTTCFIEGYHQNHDVLTFSAAEEEMRRALENRSKVVSLASDTSSLFPTVVLQQYSSTLSCSFPYRPEAVRVLISILSNAYF